MSPLSRRFLCIFPTLVSLIITSSAAEPVEWTSCSAIVPAASTPATLSPVPLFSGSSASDSSVNLLVNAVEVECVAVSSLFSTFSARLEGELLDLGMFRLEVITADGTTVVGQQISPLCFQFQLPSCTDEHRLRLILFAASTSNSKLLLSVSAGHNCGPAGRMHRQLQSSSSRTPTATYSTSRTSTATSSATRSMSATSSGTRTVSATSTESRTVTPTSTSSATPAATPSVTLSISVSPSFLTSITSTPSRSASVTAKPTQSLSTSPSPASLSGTPSYSPSASPSNGTAIASSTHGLSSASIGFIALGLSFGMLTCAGIAVFVYCRKRRDEVIKKRLLATKTSAGVNPSRNTASRDSSLTVDGGVVGRHGREHIEPPPLQDHHSDTEDEWDDDGDGSDDDSPWKSSQRQLLPPRSAFQSLAAPPSKEKLSSTASIPSFRPVPLSGVLSHQSIRHQAVDDGNQSVRSASTTSSVGKLLRMMKPLRGLLSKRGLLREGSLAPADRNSLRAILEATASDVPAQRGGPRRPTPIKEEQAEEMNRSAHATPAATPAVKVETVTGLLDLLDGDDASMSSPSPSKTASPAQRLPTRRSAAKLLALKRSVSALSTPSSVRQAFDIAPAVSGRSSLSHHSHDRQSVSMSSPAPVQPQHLRRIPAPPQSPHAHALAELRAEQDRLIQLQSRLIESQLSMSHRRSRSVGPSAVSVSSDQHSMRALRPVDVTSSGEGLTQMLKNANPLQLTAFNAAVVSECKERGQKMLQDGRLLLKAVNAMPPRRLTRIPPPAFGYSPTAQPPLHIHHGYPVDTYDSVADASPAHLRYVGIRQPMYPPPTVVITAEGTPSASVPGSEPRRLMRRSRSVGAGVNVVKHAMDSRIMQHSDSKAVPASPARMYGAKSTPMVVMATPKSFQKRTASNPMSLSNASSTEASPALTSPDSAKSGDDASHDVDSDSNPSPLPSKKKPLTAATLKRLAMRKQQEM